ncbi:hypothetical protein HAX54_002933 [Datura stramonium]|uniref:Uncharacterized protein n=1 Tax=Datura stramonium TaxID=4076 RepID=A0ABS8WWA8_DATST|nr:hypothetical protein [Datura stramonium]
MARGKSKILTNGKNRGRGGPRKILLAPFDGTANTPATTNAISKLDETPITTSIGISLAEVSSSHVPTRSSYGKDLEASRSKKGKPENSNGTIPNLHKSVEIAEEKEPELIQSLKKQGIDGLVHPSTTMKDVVIPFVEEQLLSSMLNPEDFPELSACRTKSSRGYEKNMKHMDPPPKGAGRERNRRLFEKICRNTMVVAREAAYMWQSAVVQVSSEKMNGEGEEAACCLRRCCLVVFFPVGGSGVRQRAVGREGEEVFRPTVAEFDGENGEGKVRRETTAGVVLFG